MPNFLDETICAIEKSGHQISNIAFIGSKTHGCSWAKFRKMADVTYDASWGCAKVAIDLIIIFSDETYITRKEYDGSEWWSVHPPMEIPEGVKPIKRLIGDYWPTLADLQDDDDDHHNPEPD